MATNGKKSAQMRAHMVCFHVYHMSKSLSTCLSRLYQFSGHDMAILVSFTGMPIFPHITVQNATKSGKPLSQACVLRTQLLLFGVTDTKCCLFNYLIVKQLNYIYGTAVGIIVFVFFSSHTELVTRKYETERRIAAKYTIVTRCQRVSGNPF